MLTKAQFKYIRSLTKQKFRDEFKVFIAEGEKIAGEWLASEHKIEMIVCTDEWLLQSGAQVRRHPEAQVHVVKDHELEQLSTLQTPNRVLLVVPMPAQTIPKAGNEWWLALDDIQDPGNMGTIIRIADWFGIRNLVCSPGCVDVYNSKVVQSAMGGHLRINIIESNLVPLLESIPLQKVAATLHGQNVYGMERRESGVLIIGNESKGISDAVLKAVDVQVTIPRKGGAESLNAGVSAGILCALLLPC